MYHTFLLDENDKAILVGNPITNKKIKEFKRAIFEMSNDTVVSVYSEYALDYLKADKKPLNLEEIIEKAQERQRLANEQDSEKSID